MSFYANLHSNLRASNTLELICYENFKNKVSSVNPNTEKLFDIIIYPSWICRIFRDLSIKQPDISSPQSDDRTVSLEK